MFLATSCALLLVASRDWEGATAANVPVLSMFWKGTLGTNDLTIGSGEKKILHQSGPTFFPIHFPHPWPGCGEARCRDFQLLAVICDLQRAAALEVHPAPVALHLDALTFHGLERCNRPILQVSAQRPLLNVWLLSIYQQTLVKV